MHGHNYTIIRESRVYLRRARQWHVLSQATKPASMFHSIYATSTTNATKHAVLTKPTVHQAGLLSSHLSLHLSNSK